MADGNDQFRYEYISCCRKCEHERRMEQHRPYVARSLKMTDEEMKHIQYDAKCLLANCYLTKKDVLRITQRAKWPFKGGKRNES